MASATLRSTSGPGPAPGTATCGQDPRQGRGAGFQAPGFHSGFLSNPTPRSFAKPEGSLGASSAPKTPLPRRLPAAGGCPGTAVGHRRCCRLGSKFSRACRDCHARRRGGDARGPLTSASASPCALLFLHPPLHPDDAGPSKGGTDVERHPKPRPRCRSHRRPCGFGKSAYIRRYILAKPRSRTRKKHLGFRAKCLIRLTYFW